MSEHDVKLVAQFHKFGRTKSNDQLLFPAMIYKILYEPKTQKIHLPIVSTKHIQGIIPCNKSMLAASGNEKDGATCKTGCLQMTSEHNF